jgi:branched-subunit amino acid transport protein
MDGSAEMNVWLVIIIIGVITFATRLSFILFFSRMKVTPFLQRALRFVPPAVLSAIILPELVLREGVLELTSSNERLFAGILAALVAWRTRNVLLTLGAGMVALWILQAFL